MSKTSTPRISTNNADTTGVSLLTPPGAGAIAVIRLTGAKAEERLVPFLRASDGSPIPQSAWSLSAAAGTPHLGDHLRRAVFHDGTEALDDVLVVGSPDPVAGRCVDICAHGGIRVVERIIAALVQSGAEFRPSDQALAEAWPAANLIEGECWSALSFAQTRRAVRWLLTARRTLPAELRRIAGVARNDFPAARQALRALIDRAPACRCLVDGATVAIVGPANAGKSTLANRLLGTERILVSPRAGTTLDWVAERAAISGVPVTVIDTPGYGPHRSELDAAAMHRASDRTQSADLVLRVFDGSILPPTAADHSPTRKRGSIASRRKRGDLLVLNKRDLGVAWSAEHMSLASVDAAPVAISARDGTGIRELHTRIIEALGLEGLDDRLIGFFTDRQCRLAETDSLANDGAALIAVIWEDLLGENMAD